jgi:hypothetical protein
MKTKARFSLLCSSAAAVTAAVSTPAAADIIRVDGLGVSLSGGLSLDINNDGSNDLSLSNLFSNAGWYYTGGYYSDHSGSYFYNRSVNASGLGVGSVVAQGALIGPSTTFAGAVTLDRTSVSTTYGEVGYHSEYHSYSYSCGYKGWYTCWSGYYTYPADYGTIGQYSVSNGALGANLLLPFAFLAGGQVDFGWLDLSILDQGNQTPYSVLLNGYGYDDSGSAVRAGADAYVTPVDPPLLPPAQVPEPDSLLILATGLMGLAAYRRREYSKIG